MRLKLKEINFGKIDAYNEYLTSGDEIFKKSFYCHPSLQFDKIMNGEIYYICGNKGTGKTMLLKYIELKLKECPTENIIQFVRFKKDIDETDRNEIKRVSVPLNGFEEVVEKDIPSDNSINSVLAWEVYLIKIIVKLIEKSEFGIFDRYDDNWLKLQRLIDLIYKDDESSIHKILPKVKRGKVEIDIAKILKLGIDVEWDSTDKTGVPFNNLAKKIISLYGCLKPSSCKLFILIDELELSLNKNKSYDRDITLIRDLVIAVQYLSEESKVHNFSIYFIAAIRNEVYKHLLSSGMEINKPINDFGVQITWQQKGGNIGEHPLIQMIEQKIAVSEKKNDIISTNLWKNYFATFVHSTPIKKYILDQTWLKPRDIIRLFNLMQKHFPDKDFIDQACFDTIRQQYSEECWTELAEELRVKYTNNEVEGIKHCLLGLRLPFSTKDFERQIEEKSTMFESVECIKKREKNINFILKDLYDVGIIGNYRPGRFYFMGEFDFNPTNELTIHYPLQKFFKTTKKCFNK